MDNKHLQQAKQRRKFIPANFEIDGWENIRGYFEHLMSANPGSGAEVMQWLVERSELEAVLEEDMAWRYINMNRDTGNQEYADRFNEFMTNIHPNVIREFNKLDEKFISSGSDKKIDQKQFHVFIRALKKQLELFREENVPLLSQLQVEKQEFGKISSRMTIQYDNKELTLQQAANYLKNPDRNVREEVYRLIVERRMEDTGQLDELLTRLIEKRHEVAINAGYKNYRDYIFDDLGRFDYTVSDCFEFHEAIKKHICPLVKAIHVKRKQNLGLDKLRPWDLDVDPEGKPPLEPFNDSGELVDKTIQCFKELKPEFGDFLLQMKTNGYLDLDSRKGKAPGGFNYPLYESNMPFIYMNSTGNFRDLVTMMHEGGHAIHSFLSKDLTLVAQKSLPSEVAELASMSMELMSMEYWSLFFDTEESLTRAKRKQLEGVLEVLPWIAVVDKFQHWLYETPRHTIEERKTNWLRIFHEFMSPVVSWDGFEEFLSWNWQKQLHIFEVPFYYIEYGIAQLGAIAVWKNFCANKSQAIKMYTNALELGYSIEIPKIYHAAGIEFDFSSDYIRELAHFVNEKLDELT